MIKIGNYEYDYVGDFQPDGTALALLDGEMFHIGKDGKRVTKEGFKHYKCKKCGEKRIQMYASIPDVCPDCQAMLDRNKVEWIATEWQNEEYYRSLGKKGINITIHRLNSPYYSGERFAVRDGSMCLSVDGEFEYETSPSNRTDRFYEKFRFKTFDKAKEMADVKLRSLPRSGKKL